MFSARGLWFKRAVPAIPKTMRAVVYRGVNDLRVETVPLVSDLRSTVEQHLQHTGSAVAGRLLEDWDTSLTKFRKVMPMDYRRVLRVMREAEAAGLSEEEMFKRVMESAHG